MPFVSITRLRIRAVRFLPAFLVDTLLSARQVKRAEGYLGGRMLADRRQTYWTMTAWTDAAAMRAYMTAGPHRRAMPKLMRWCDQASIAHWVQDDATLPAWEEADRRMRDEGRVSKVHHAAEGHDPMTFDPPRTIGGVMLPAVGRR
jgi:heme-degrading monooxygenase HmoA